MKQFKGIRGLSKVGDSVLSPMPLIDYKGNTLAVGSDGVRYLADSGISPKSNAELFYGRGPKLDGNGQGTSINIADANVRDFTVSCMFEVTGTSEKVALAGGFNDYGRFTLGEVTPNKVNFNVMDIDAVHHSIAMTNVPVGLYVVIATWNESLKEVNLEVNNVEATEAGVSYYSVDGDLYIGCRHNATQYLNGIINNIILMKDIILTPTQKQQLYNFPERFVYPDKQLQADGSYKWFPKSEFLNQDELDSFVVHAPGCDNDGFFRNMIGYSETPEAIVTTTVTQGDEVSTYSIDGLYVTIDVTTVGTQAYRPLITWDFGDSILYDLYLVSLDLNVISGIVDLSEPNVNIGSETGEVHFGQVYGVGTYKLYVVIKANGTDGTFRIGTNNLNSHNAVFSNLAIKKLTNTYEFSNFTQSILDEGLNLNTGSQTCFYDTDERGVICGSNFKSIAMNGVAYPALAIPITDTELDGTEGKWVIEFAIRRVGEVRNVTMLTSYTPSTGMILYTSRSYNKDLISFVMYDGVATVNVTATLADDVAGWIQIENDGTNITMLLDGVETSTNTHNFLPSGRTFKDSIQKCPNGKLANFKMWYGDNYYKYDRAKSLKLGLIAKSLL